MSIQTVDNLSTKLDAELAWRKKELSDFKYLIEQAEQAPRRRRALGRSGITMLYAHWEGFVKLSSRHFLEFIAMQRLTNQDLAPNLLTLSLQSTLNFASESKKTSEFWKVTEFFTTRLATRARLPFKTGLATESNLSSAVLKEITWCLGVNYQPYETKEKFLDSKLLARRNHIAHGEEIDVDPKEFSEMRDVVSEMMNHFKTELENIAALGSYLSPR